MKTQSSDPATRCHVCRWRACLLVAVAALAATPVWASPSFRVDKNYPEIGLRMRTLSNSSPEPLPLPQTFRYTFTRGEETEQKDLFDVRELWYATQHVGQWRDSAGNLLIIGRATQQLPRIAAMTPQGHVSREVFDAALNTTDAAVDPANANSLTTWIKEFSGCAAEPPESLRTDFNLTDALFFPLADPGTLLYAFRAKIRSISSQSAPSDWFCAIVKIQDGTLKSKVRKDFEAQFLVNLAALPRSGLSTPARAPQNAVATASRSAAIPDHPSRTAARKSIANMSGWWYAETPEYIFLSDIRSTTGRTLVREFQQIMPKLRSAFTRLIPPFDEDVDISVVRIFEEPQAYQQYVGKEHAWSSGLWSSMRRELVILSQGKERQRTMDIIAHEGFHQYLFYATGRIENAVWFNEGHACFFECARIDNRGHVEIPENARVQHLQRNFDAAVALIPQVLVAGHDAFYQGSEASRDLHYTTAWALVYFLRKGVPTQKLDAQYGKILDTYLASLMETQDAATATRTAFEGIEMPRFQKAFTDFWKRGRSAAQKYDLFSPARGRKTPINSLPMTSTS